MSESLLTMPLSETSKIIYIMLLDRARLSIVNADYTDRQGHIFVYYPLDDIAADIDRSRTTVKNALTALEDSKLILRVHQCVGQASRIYVKIPREYKGKNLTVPRTVFYQTLKINNRNIRTMNTAINFSATKELLVGGDSSDGR